MDDKNKQAEPVAWTRIDTIKDEAGYSIGMDEPEVQWGEERPDGDSWQPLYARPAARLSLTEHDAESLRMIAGWMDRDGIPDAADTLRRLAAPALSASPAAPIIPPAFVPSDWVMDVAGVVVKLDEWEPGAEKARDFFRTRGASPAALTVPEGWKLVPEAFIDKFKASTRATNPKAAMILSDEANDILDSATPPAA